MVSDKINEAIVLDIIIKCQGMILEEATAA